MPPFTSGRMPDATLLRISGLVALDSTRRYGTERMRQKLFVVASGMLVNISTRAAPAELVACGIQLGDDKLVERSNA